MRPLSSLALICIPLAALAGGCATGIETSGNTGGNDTTSASGTGGTGGHVDPTSSVVSSSNTGMGPCVFDTDCPANGDPCTEPTCINGECKTKSANDGATCEDGDWCTDGDTCLDGTCLSGNAKYCPPPDTCQVGVCDPVAKNCGSAPGNDGAQCDDNDPCTSWGVCSAGTCSKGSPIDCSFLDGICADGVCDPQIGCTQQPKNDGAPCDDSLFCTINDVCTGGVCSGVPNTCAAPGDVCLIGSCDEAQNKCTAVPGNNGAACDDKNLCTTGEICTNGTCGGGAPTNQGGACDDGNTCTAGDTCANGVCQGTTITQCINGDGCCPSGCTLQDDDDCNCSINLATGATPSISDGGKQAPYTVSNMNDGVLGNVCQFAWVSNNTQPNGAWMMYTWPQPVTIGSIYIDTEKGMNPGPPCNNPPGRNVASGTVQWWNGATWVDATSFSGQHDDVQVNIQPSVTTTQLRVYNMTTDPGNGNSIIYEWYVYGAPNCDPNSP